MTIPWSSNPNPVTCVCDATRVDVLWDEVVVEVEEGNVEVLDPAVVVVVAPTAAVDVVVVATDDCIVNIWYAFLLDVYYEQDRLE